MSWEEPPTGAQIHKITRLALVLGIQEPLEEGIRSRGQARDILNGLYLKLQQRNKAKRIRLKTG